MGLQVQFCDLVDVVIINMSVNSEESFQDLLEHRACILAELNSHFGGKICWVLKNAADPVQKVLDVFWSTELRGFAVFRGSIVLPEVLVLFTSSHFDT